MGMDFGKAAGAWKASSSWDVLLFGILLAFLSTMSAGAQGEHSKCQDLQRSPTLTMFKDALPIPPTIDVSTGAQLTLGTYKITQKLHSDLPATPLYAYGTSPAAATYPGPSLMATRHIPSQIRFENHINDTTPFLIVDRTLHWANPPNGGVPTVTHLHGAEAPSQYDGHPDAWFTMHGDHGPTFVTQNNTYPNSQPATLLWYHDHSVGITRITVLSGLSGLYFIRCPSEEPPSLPSGVYEVPLVIQDKTFWGNGSINFPDVGGSPSNHPNWCPEYFGDTILVNGKVWPYLQVYPAKYRFRILNAANARFFNLTFSQCPSLKFHQIGTDGGFLPFTMTLSSLLLAPAYRVDVIVDFSGVAVGTSCYMNNSAPAPFPIGVPALSPPQTNSVMKFIIKEFPPGVTAPVQVIPIIYWGPGYVSGPNNAILMPVATSSYRHRNLTLTEQDDASGNPVQSLINNLHWTDPVTETPTIGTVEIWEIINLTPDAHPMHIHLIDFLTVNMQQFNANSYNDNNCSITLQYPNSNSCFTQLPQVPDQSQVGWKDTVIVYPSTVTRLWTRWAPRLGGPFPFNATSFPGYVWHCHIVDHEDNDMMRPMQPIACLNLEKQATANKLIWAMRLQETSSRVDCAFEYTSP